MNIREFAKLCGVSASSASRALNRPPEQAEMGRALYDKIRAKAAELGYWPNYYAQRMQSAHSDKIGFIVGGETYKLLFGELIDAIATVLRPQQKSLTVFYCQNVVEDIMPALEKMIHQGMDAIIIHPSTTHKIADIEKMLKDIKQRYPVLPPIVTVFSRFKALKCIEIHLDEAAIGRQAAERQLALKCRTFGVLCPSTSNPRNEAIIRSYCDTLKKHGIPKTQIIRVNAGYPATPEELRPLADVEGLWLSFLLAFPGMRQGLQEVCSLENLHVDTFCTEESVSVFQWLCPNLDGEDMKLHPFKSLYIALASIQKAGKAAAEAAIEAAYAETEPELRHKVDFRYVNFDESMNTTLFR